MALTVGGVVANLGARLDDDAFDRWEKRVTKVRRDARDDVEVSLKGDHDEAGFRRFDERLTRARRRAHDRLERGGGPTTRETLRATNAHTLEPNWWVSYSGVFKVATRIRAVCHCT